MAKIKLELPWPPSVNRYYRHVAIHGSPRVLISKEGRDYRNVVTAIVGSERTVALEKKCRICIDAYPPDCRRRDVDNILKCLLDSLVASGIVNDDSLFVDLRIIKREPIPEENGKVYIEMEEIE